jgi:hypothetical protein
MKDLRQVALEEDPAFNPGIAKMKQLNRLMTLGLVVPVILMPVIVLAFPALAQWAFPLGIAPDAVITFYAMVRKL